MEKGSGNRYFWLKLKREFFSQREIKKMMRLNNGHLITICYLKILLFSLQMGGEIVFEGTETDIYEQISLEIDEKSEHVKSLFEFLLDNQVLVKLAEDKYLLTEVGASIRAESASAERMRKHRGRKNNNLDEKTSHCDTHVTPTCHNVQKSDVEKEKEKEKDKKEKQEKEKKFSDEAKLILQFLNEKTGSRFRAIESNLRPIEATLNTRATLGQIKAVIAKKVREWSSNEDMKQYLRPATLFRRSNFESYYGQLNWESKNEQTKIEKS